MAPIIPIKAVTQVPTFAPKVINKPLSIPIAPLPTITITIPVIADDDCIMAVKSIPKNSKINGKLIFCKTSAIKSFIESSLHALLINFNPTNIIPNPDIKFAIFFIFLINASITPINTNNDRYREIFKLSKEAKRPVTVVPIFEPIIIAAAWLRVITLAFTNPITITVVAEELWITAVTKAPIKTPFIRFPAIFSNKFFILSPAISFKLSLINFIANMKTPTPPINESIHS